METRARIPSFITDRTQSIVLGTLFAILAVVLVVVYVKHYKSNVKSRGDVVPVLVATHTIAAGTPASSIAGSVQLEHILLGNRASGAVAALGDVRGKFVSENIYRGDQITLTRFRPLADQGITGQIAGKLRILQVTGDASQLLSGTLQAGDHVDVLASVQLPGTSGNVPVTRAVLRNLKVLTTPASKKGGAFSSSKGNISVLLRLTDAQAQKLYYIVNNADWTFVLRPRGGVASNSSSSVDWAGTLLSGGLGPVAQGVLSQAKASGNR
jgi:Flp pilus assembly protein CpaB